MRNTNNFVDRAKLKSSRIGKNKQKLSDYISNCKIMWKKITELLSSRRFWLIVLGGILVWLQTNDWKLGAISAITAIVGVGTLDKFSK